VEHLLEQLEVASQVLIEEVVHGDPFVGGALDEPGAPCLSTLGCTWWRLLNYMWRNYWRMRLRGSRQLSRCFFDLRRTPYNPRVAEIDLSPVARK
jgi:hypothetical protein